jgi:nitrous oxide reductase
MKKGVDRRSFLKSSALAGALGAIGTGSVAALASCSSTPKILPLKEPGSYYLPNLVDMATDGHINQVG